MRIFLSYPSEERETAARVNYALLAREHDVFFDRSDLPAGREFDGTIAAALAQSDLLVFLLTPASLERGRYTLTELRLAERRWPHPSGRVLPVLVRPMDYDAIPPYLRAVSILEPHGDTAADVADAVERLAASHAGAQWFRRRRLRAIAAGLAALTLAAVAAYTWGAGFGRRDIRDDSGARASTGLAAPAAARNTTPLPAEWRTRARAVAAGSDGYVVALAAPAELRRMTDRHEQQGDGLPLPGEPTGIVPLPTQLLVVTRAKDAVVVVNRADLGLVMTIPMEPPRQENDQPISSDIRSVAIDQGLLWAVTGDRDGAASILKHRGNRWSVPSWGWGDILKGADLDARGLRLRTVGGALWAVSAETTPSSLYRIVGAVRVDEFKGHDLDMVSCATDLAESHRGNLLFLSCGNELQEVRPDGKQLVLEQARPTLDSDNGPAQWVDERIVPAERTVFVAFNTYDIQPTFRPRRTRLARVAEDGTVLLAEFAQASIGSLAVSPRWAVIVLKKADGSFEAAAVARNPES